MWTKGVSGNPNGRRLTADEDWLPGETKEERVKRRAKARSAQWRAENKERAAANSVISRARRKENWGQFLEVERHRYQKTKTKKLAQQKLERETNPDRVKARRKKHYELNKEEYVARCAYRRAAKLQATPKWVNRSEIEEIYKTARAITVKTGIPHEVDHIEPLKGKDRSGLHVPWNLQIITRSENRAKHNKTDH